MNIKFLKTSEKNFKNSLEGFLNFDSSNNEKIVETTNNILVEIKKRGDEALLEFTKKFDGLVFSDASDLEITQNDINAAFERVSSEQKEALMEAAKRIFTYHEKQRWNHGPTMMMKAQGLAKKLLRLIELDCMFLEGKQPTPHRF